jgi:hypothetical protein
MNQREKEIRYQKILDRRTEVIEEMEGLSKTDLRYMMFNQEQYLLLQQLEEETYYKESNWKTVFDHFPIRVYDDDIDMFLGSVGKIVSSHFISEVRIDVSRRGKRNYKFYCRDCRKIIAYVEEDKLYSLVCIPWEDAMMVKK